MMLVCRKGVGPHVFSAVDVAMLVLQNGAFTLPERRAARRQRRSGSSIPYVSTGHRVSRAPADTLCQYWSSHTTGRSIPYESTASSVPRLQHTLCEYRTLRSKFIGPYL
eukprot:786023-Rhodomonas_salina.2